MADSLVDLQSLVEWNRSVLNPPITPGFEAMVLDHFNRYAARLRDTTSTAAPAGEAATSPATAGRIRSDTATESDEWDAVERVIPEMVAAAKAALSPPGRAEGE